MVAAHSGSLAAVLREEQTPIDGFDKDVDVIDAAGREVGVPVGIGAEEEVSALMGDDAAPSTALTGATEAATNTMNDPEKMSQSIFLSRVTKGGTRGAVL
jgi:hypothetical protein